MGDQPAVVTLSGRTFPGAPDPTTGIMAACRPTYAADQLPNTAAPEEPVTAVLDRYWRRPDPRTPALLE
jgi:hypothetical protein